MNNQHHASILEANYYLSVYNVHFKLALSTDPVLTIYTKI